MFVPIWALGLGAVVVLGLLAWAITRGGSERRDDLIDPRRALMDRARADGFDEAAVRRIADRGGDDRYEMPGISGLVPDPVAGTEGSVVGMSEELRQEVWKQLQAGYKVNAVKLVRERTGLGLRESKDLVDALGQSDAMPR